MTKLNISNDGKSMEGLVECDDDVEQPSKRHSKVASQGLEQKFVRGGEHLVKL